MSESPAGSAKGPSRWSAWSAWSLRARLLVGLLALLSVVCVGIGVVAEVALYGVLTDQRDSQLESARNRFLNADRRPPSPPAPPDRPENGPRFLFLAGNAEDTLGATVSDGRVVAGAVLGATGQPRPLSDAVKEQLAELPVDDEPRTVSLGEYGDYRVAVSETPDGDHIITGLPLDDARAAVLRLASILVLVAVGGILAALAGGVLLVTRSLRPLRRVASTARDVTALPLDRGDVAIDMRVPASDTDTRTEVGQVGAALNHMLHHVGSALSARHASEMRVRQFVADAGHELRTPLAAIRGYAEVTRRGRDELPDDTAHALRRMESEAERMTHLVEDLLLLARLDAGRPLARDAVDLSRLVLDTVSDARVAGPGHRWRMDLPEEPVVVPGDPHRLHQVLANLLANARTHTPAGTTITARLGRPGGDAVRLSVVDDGPGIPDELRPTVFERFARGDSSRSRHAGSTGLGLAIVAAVVESHRGTVAVASRPGRTAFTVVLPAS